MFDDLTWQKGDCSRQTVQQEKARTSDQASQCVHTEGFKGQWKHCGKTVEASEESVAGRLPDL